MCSGSKTVKKSISNEAEHDQSSLLSFFLTVFQLLKHINLRRNPSLELAFILICSYAPYGLAEGLELSGKYSHLNDCFSLE